MRRIAIIGGGIAGLISGIRLAKRGVHCEIFEKKAYPFHRVCGEYISNETVPFLKSEGIYPEAFSPPVFSRFCLSSVSGKQETLKLDLGGFGISRYAFDYFLYEHAVRAGVIFHLNTEVDAVTFVEDTFRVTTGDNTAYFDLVIGAHGKRSKLDVKLDRRFISKRSPYVGVKYHVMTENDADLISLHNFEGGYCGVSNVEDSKTNICYLVHRDTLRQYGDVAVMQENVLFKNPLLKNIFRNSEFLFKRPEVINEISFEVKGPVEDHILMVGDAAGMITPLCGNGMGMAIHASKIATDLVFEYSAGNLSRSELEHMYRLLWKKNFARRLWAGRQIQRLFGNTVASGIAINLALHIKPIAYGIMRNTHGDPF